MNTKKLIRYIYGWVLIRPIRWAFGNMIRNYALYWLPKREPWEDSRRITNIHWWILYRTVFKLCKWMYYDAWRKFCTWGKYGLTHKPLIARIIHRIGKNTAGYAIRGNQCFHCGHDDGCQCELSSDETGVYFTLIDAYTTATENGKDYQFRGITTCPKCGYKAEYCDGSL